ncbi:hypothetical protein QFZ87_004537 [Bacillus sp. SLBN-46]|nr:hypothetical protein [Bacillus sp. SLBN-46]
MKDKTKRGHLENVLHQAHEGQNEARTRGKCPSSGS